MKKLTMIACALAALPLCAETWYFSGAGKHYYVDDGKNDWGYGWGYTGTDANWTNALGVAGAPAAGDTAILPARKLFICGYPWNSSDALETFITQGNFCLMQGSLYMRPGGQGVVIGGTGGETWWSGLSLQSNPDSDATEVVMTVPANKTVSLQKGVDCNGLTFVKDGAGALNLHCQGLGNYPKINNATIKLRGGAFIDYATTCYTGTHLVFDSNDASACARLEAYDGIPQNWGIKDGAIEETDAVQNTGHGFTSADTAFSYLFTLSGTPAVNPMRFTGTFSKRAGLVWNPDASDAVFEFAKGVSTTVGDLHVSNGVVRVTEGATFTSLSNLVVGANASLVFTTSAGAGFTAQDVEILAGGTVNVAKDLTLVFDAATAGGAALAPGFHTAATDPAWLTGEGRVYVPDGAPATTTTATWTGARAPTRC